MSLVVVPHTELSADVLRSLIEEFVTRHGAIQGEEVALDTQIAQVRRQLEAKTVVIVYDELEESCNIVTQQELVILQRELEGPRIEPAE
jgi:hypothetical protein